MSTKPKDSEYQLEKEHGTMRSYITGFILSLALTTFAYYLVVSKQPPHTTLLAIVLGFAFLQMAVQVLFFLHLGRGPQPQYNVVFFFATISIILVVILGSVFIINNLHYNMTPKDITTKLAEAEAIAQVGGNKTGACPEVRTNHKVVISNGIVSPSHTEARLCDSLTFISEDTVVHEIAFGPHDQHEVYGGEYEMLIHKGFPKIITLNQSGTHTFHDHLNDALKGDFTVNP